MSFGDPQTFLALLLGCVLATSAALHSTAADCKPAGLRACCQSHRHMEEWDVSVPLSPERVLNWNKA